MSTDPELEKRLAALESELGLLKFNFSQLVSFLQSARTAEDKANTIAKDLTAKFHESIVNVYD